MFDAANEVVQRAQQRVGTTLKGKWTIDSLIGVGGMACVYAATHRNNKRAAIKMLHPELSIHSDIRARFLREGYVANTVGHTGAVSVLDDDVAEDGAAYIVMELLDGETVLARAERKGGRLPLDDVLSVADQLLDVLVAAHANGIVHRDIKPENLFLDRSGQLKVLDFGIARLRESADKSQSGTRTGSLMGTPSFMPPEQARGLWDQVDGRSDLWAVGATMFTLLAGRVVHKANTANEALALAITQRAPSLASVMPDAPPRLVELVDRSLAYEKELRYADAAAMQMALREVYAVVHEQPVAVELARRVPALSLPDATGPGTALVQWPTSEAAEASRHAIPAHTPVASPGGQSTTGGVASASAPLLLVPRRRSIAPRIVIAAVAIAGIGVVALFALRGGHASLPAGAASAEPVAAALASAPAAPPEPPAPAPAESAAAEPVDAPPSTTPVKAAAAPKPARPVAAKPAKPAAAKPAPPTATKPDSPAPAAAAAPPPAPTPAPVAPTPPAPKKTDSLGGRL